MTNKPSRKGYDPKRIEPQIYRFWQESGYFHTEPPAKGGRNARPFTIVIPPPNVTGALHLGHAINNTLQDILVRRRRMQGYNALWVPGTDHAGIATQAVVEKRIFEDEGKSRHDLGRDELVRRIWQWKEQYGNRILEQLQLMGCSCDWPRTRFTLDETCARAVRWTFFRLFADGLIYRGKRLVNWDAQLQTAVADDEVYHETVKGHLWHIRYPLEDGTGHLVVATTRPETMLGDTAVAVHPEDERYKHLIGKRCILPILNRPLPIIADPILVDPSFGSGCVKVTPAHDPNDYDCGLRSGLEMINILNPDGTINENGGPFAGMDRDEARKAVVAELEKLGLLERVEDYETQVGHSDRSKTPIEPYLSDQWFVRMSELAEAAMEVVRQGRVKFHPERYAKTYLDWLGEKRDWCISRQLWWGHRIPIWYCRTCTEEDLRNAFADRDDICWRPDEQRGGWLICSQDEDLAPDALGADHRLEQDPDVLDTWFSSALWPHSVLGWPEATAELAFYYPTDVLITAREIITLWVARMVMTGLYNLGEVPFHDVYIHAVIQDGQGRPMKKSLGNGVDPADIIDMYGADALRFTLAYMATETQDVRMPVKRTKLPDGREVNTSERFEIGRNFCNKLWQAATGVVLANLDGYDPQPLRYDSLPLEDRWILSRLQTAILTIDGLLEAFNFSDAAQYVYKFFWNELCDWYLEMVKPRLRAEPAQRCVAQQVLAWVLDGSLRLLHPFMPFVTEALWADLNKAAPHRGIGRPAPCGEALIVAEWPRLNPALRSEQVESQMQQLQDLIRAVRDALSRVNESRARQREPVLRALPKAVVRAGGEFCRLLAGQRDTFTRLARCEHLELGPDAAKPPGSMSFVCGEVELFVPVAELIDLAVERDRLAQEIAKAEKALATVEAKLANENFVNRAPERVVQQQRDRQQALQQQLETLRRHYAEVSGE